MKISYSAPAKVILSGEHAVVYGKPSLVSAINKSLKFSLLEATTKTNDKNILHISQVVKKYLKKEKIDFLDKKFNFKIESDIPIGRGLGSSAALSVTSSAAFLEFYTGRQFEKNIINDIAFQIEKHFHQNPSGVDNSAACYGGLILYQKNVKIKNLDFKIPKNIEEKLFLIDSGKPKETTGEMVNFVGTKSVGKILYEIKITTKKLEESIAKENINLFKESLVNNENLLEQLGIVSEKTKKLLKDLSKFGVGKVTGAGGRETNSGFIIFLAEDKEKLQEFLKNKKINYFNFIPDNQGLKKIIKVKASAPGKLMLFGEHAVVYDYPCIVTTVSPRVYVEIEEISGCLKIDSPQVKDNRFVEETVKLFCEKYSVNNNLLIKTHSDFSSQYGFGSSSAVTVATILALSKLYKIKISKKDIFNLGHKVVLNIQKVGSGFDIASATYGRTIYFVTGGKVIEPLPVKNLSLVIGYSGTKASTTKIVKDLNPDFKIFNQIKKIVEKAKISLVNADWKTTGELMNQNHRLLQKLGVSTQKLDKMCEAATSSGAFGAKLSGAGGGDCIISLVPKNKIKNVESSIISVGGEIIKVKNNI
ncbi:MAG: mevalonate kinase [Patescibacteria group bacterium]